MSVTCMYCERDARQSELMYPVKEYELATVFLHRNTVYPGRCILAMNRHVRTMTDLSDEERDAFFAIATSVARAIEAVFSPDQINYLMLGDIRPHLHLHLVPKYENGADFGQIFRMMPEEGDMMDDAACSEIVGKLLQYLD